MGINQTLNYLLNAVVLLFQKYTQDCKDGFHALIKIANGYDYHAAQNAIMEPVRESKDTTPKSHIVITQANIVFHISNLSSPSEPLSYLKSGNYQATLTVPISSEGKGLGFIENIPALVFEFDTTYLTEVLYEPDKAIATMSGHNHTFQFEEKSVELTLSSSPLFHNLHMGKQNDIVNAIECATGTTDKREIGDYFERLHAFEQQFQNAPFNTLNVQSIQALELLNVSGNNLVMGVLQPDGSVYLQNDMCSFKLEPSIDTHLFVHQGDGSVSPFPFTPEVLKSIFALQSLDISHINYCVIANKLLIEIAHVRLEFTLPYKEQTFVKECNNDLNSLQPLYSEPFTLRDTKERILKEIEASQKCQVFLSINIAAGEVSTSLVKSNGRVRTFTIFEAQGQLHGHRIHTKELKTVIEAVNTYANIKIFAQDYKGVNKVYLEVQNGKHSYANELVELKR